MCVRILYVSIRITYTTKSQEQQKSSECAYAISESTKAKNFGFLKALMQSYAHICIYAYVFSIYTHI